MTFDDGILIVYRVEDTSAPGDMPKMEPVEKTRLYYSFDIVGMSRYYTALQAHIQLSHVVNVPGWPALDTDDLIALEDGNVYRLAQIQPMTDEDGLRISKLSLERVSDEYHIATG